MKQEIEALLDILSPHPQLLEGWKPNNLAHLVTELEVMGVLAVGHHCAGKREGDHLPPLSAGQKAVITFCSFFPKMAFCEAHSKAPTAPIGLKFGMQCLVD